MHLLIHSLEHSIVVLPFLYLIYLTIGYLEKRKSLCSHKNLSKLKRFGPMLGGILGCIPQCGVSVMGAKLYSQRLITLGTLMAIFLSTSDEAIPILLANLDNFNIVFMVLFIKIILAVIAGIVIDLFVIQKSSKFNGILLNTNVDCGCCSNNENIWKSALIHSLKVFMYIFVVSFAVEAIIHIMGEDSLNSLLMSNSIMQPALTAALGLIPNCAISIVMTEMYIQGALSFGSLLAGLCTSAGFGLLVLFKTNLNLKENLKIVGILYLISTLAGILLQMLSII